MPDIEKILNLIMREGITVCEYLERLLLTLWEEKDNFSSKRPFGNSGWEYDLYEILIENKISRPEQNQKIWKRGQNFHECKNPYQPQAPHRLGI